MGRATTTPETSVQTAVFQIEMGRGKQIVQWGLLLLLAAATLACLLPARRAARGDVARLLRAE